MYIPKHYEETDVGVLHELILAHPLGAWVTHINGDFRVNHIPFLVDRSRGEHGILVGHVARNNNIHKLLAKSGNCVVIFQGSEGYITPSWYPSKHVHGKVVPTWNYAVVHVHGQPHVIEDRDWLLQHINQFTDTYEAGQVNPWKVSDAPCDFIERQISAIVGIEIKINKIVGKWKVSQNQRLPDKLGVINGLLACNDARLKEMAVLVGKYSDLGNIS
jgi:transcriptional regulator